MKWQLPEFNPHIFDPEENTPFGILGYTASEVRELRDYIYEFSKQYPVCKLIDQLLYATYHFKCTLRSRDAKGQQALLNSMKDMLNKFQEILNSFEADSLESKLLRGAIHYVLISIKMTMDEDSEGLDQKTKAAWQNSDLYKMTLDASKTAV